MIVCVLYILSWLFFLSWIIKLIIMHIKYDVFRSSRITENHSTFCCASNLQCLGDQSAALVGQMCFKDGQAKNTYDLYFLICLLCFIGSSITEQILLLCTQPNVSTCKNVWDWIKMLKYVSFYVVVFYLQLWDWLFPSQECRNKGIQFTYSF